jgi:hypothetical protein
LLARHRRGNNVERQRINLSDPGTANAYANVRNADAGAADYGVVIRAAPWTFEPTVANPFSEALINLNGIGDTPLIAAVGGKVIKVWRLFFQFTDNVILTIKQGANLLTGGMDFLQGGRLQLDLSSLPGSSGMLIPWFTSTAGNALIFNLSVGVQCSERIYYTQV